MGNKSRFAIMAGLSVSLAALCLASPASAAIRAVSRGTGGTGGGLTSRMLQTSDLPSGFMPYGPMIQAAGRAACRRPRRRANRPGRRAAARLGPLLGIRPDRTAGVRAGDWYAGDSSGAGEASASFASSVLARGAARQHLTAGLDGYSVPIQVDGIPYTMIAAPLARGPLLRPLRRRPGADVGGERPPAGEPCRGPGTRGPGQHADTGTSLADLQPDPYNAAGAAVGVLVGYLAIVSGVAYLRNPLRRDRRTRRSPARRQPAAGQHVVDVSSHARAYRNTARLRLVVQLIGLSLIACGADPYLVPHWYLFVLAGAAVTWAGGRFVRPAGVRPSGNQGVLSGARRVRVTALCHWAWCWSSAGRCSSSPTACPSPNLPSCQPSTRRPPPLRCPGRTFRPATCGSASPRWPPERSSHAAPAGIRGRRRVSPDAARYQAAHPVLALVR